MAPAPAQSHATRYRLAVDAAQAALHAWLVQLPDAAINADAYAHKYELFDPQITDGQLTGGRMQLFADTMHVLGLCSGKYARTGVAGDLHRAAEFYTDNQRAMGAEETPLLDKARNIAFRTFFEHLGLDPEAIMAEKGRSIP